MKNTLPHFPTDSATLRRTFSLIAASAHPLGCWAGLLVLLCLMGHGPTANAQDFAWAKRMGGSDEDRGLSIAIDASGNVYTTGLYWGTADFNPGPGTFNLTSVGGHDIFVSKLDAAGQFIWAKRLGGSGEDAVFSIAVDASGNVYTTGDFLGTADFDPGPGTFNLTSVGGHDIFVSKLNAAGDFVWAKGMGGSSSDVSSSIAVDASGNVYTTGLYRGTADFDPGPGTFNLTSEGGSSDVFVSKLDAAGNFVWAKRLGGSDGDRGLSIAIDASGNVYTTGDFQGTADFDPGPGTFNLTSVGGHDIFVSKLNAAGDFVWAKGMGGSSSDVSSSIAVDASGNVYTMGDFVGTADFDPGAGAFNLTSVAGSIDIFVSKLNDAGDFVWAKGMGGSSSDVGSSIAVDASGNVYTTGHFVGTADFDPGAGAFNLTTAGGSSDIFVSKLNDAGDFIWALRFGGSSPDFSFSIAVDASGSVYTTGSFRNTVDFDPGAGTSNLTSAGNEDSFVSKLVDASCGPNGQNKKICYYGTEQCVSEKAAKNYLKIGATLGACPANARIGYEPTDLTPTLQLSLQAYPSPTLDAVRLEVLAPTAGPADFSVLDVAGRPLQQRRQQLTKGINEVEFKLGSLPTGTYLLRVVDALNRQGITRVNKQ